MSESLSTYDITKKEFKLIINNLKSSAKKRNIPFDLTTTDLDEIGIPITCPVLGIPIYYHRGKVKDNSISIDRIDSKRGYTKDNIVVVSHRVNKLKSNATLEEMKKIVNFYNDIQ